MPCHLLRCLIEANITADSQVKQASIDHAPFQAEETWVDSVAEANATAPETEAVSDPTVAHAGLTELDTAGPNGLSMQNSADAVTSPPQGNAGNEAGNAAGDRWDTSAGAEKNLAGDSLKMVPRGQDELETPASAAPGGALEEKSMSWADEPPSYETAASGNSYEAAASGNVAGESWDMKAAGEQTDNSSAAARSATGAPQEEADGFHQVPGRHRGRGGRGRGGDGEFRGRGRGRGGFRGDGEFRGRGRGGFRGRGEGGEFRGRGGFRGRGPRGGAEGQTRGS